MGFFLAPLLGALGSSAGLTAAATVAGAAISANSTAKTNAANRELNDPVYARERLEAAGFNPNAKYNGYQAAQMVAPQHGAILAQGMAAAADQLQVDGAQKAAIAKLEGENTRLTKELQSQKINPHVAGIYGNGSNQDIDRDRTDNLLGRNGNPDTGDVSVTNAGDVGSETYVNPRVLDAETSETRYAEIGSELAGLRNIYKDNQYNDKLQRVAKGFGRSVADQVNEQYAKADGRDLDAVIAAVTKGKPRRTRPKSRPEYKQKHPSPTGKRIFNPLYSQY